MERGIFAGIGSIGRNKLGPGESTTNALFVEDNEDLCRYLMNAFQTDYRVVIAKTERSA